VITRAQVRGLLNDGMMPSFSSVASIVAPFIELPLSECSTTARPANPSNTGKPPAAKTPAGAGDTRPRRNP
jgi:hypothetical protein